MSLVLVAAAGDWQDNEIRRVEISGRRPIAVYKVSGQFYATDDTCTHGEASLADGFLDGNQIVCPFHAGSFDVKTGMPTSPPCSEPLAVHRVIIENDVVFVDLGE